MEKTKSKKRILLLCVLGLILGLIVWTIWENTALMISRIPITGNRIPPGFSGFRIAHISDLHNAEFGVENGDLLDRIAGENPDIIVITGDLVDSNHTDLAVALSFAEKAEAIAPVYYVTGNHEARLPQYDALRTGLMESGVIVLEDASVRITRGGDSVTLIGLADPNFTVQGDFSGEIPAMIRTKLADLVGSENEYTILLSHRPELFEVYAESGVDLVFSGHAHGGQFRIPLIGGLIAPDQGFFPKYDSGLYTSGNTNMIVSRGIGNSIIPLRFNNRPEIIIAELLA